MFGFDIDVIRMRDAVQRILSWCQEDAFSCRCVVTPNVDHAVMLQHHAELRQAYERADLILADGFPLIVASRLLARPLPERVAGSELVPRLFAAAHRPLSVFLLGAAEGVAERAARIIEDRSEHVQVVGTHSPPLGFEHDAEENERIILRVADASPDLLIVGLGAPKQELWVDRHRERLRAKVALCAGATIDFIAGEKAQAPVWMRRTGLEWVHRMLSEPRRLTKRYARDAWIFPRLVWQEWGRPGSRS
jgi:N-acetylglucosaminyldiphosphoundecaprenol N-acetyl-beta-D-mannosaminyltransferase